MAFGRMVAGRLVLLSWIGGALGCGASAVEWERATRENERLELLVEIKEAAPGTKVEGVTVKQQPVDPCPSDEAPEAVIPFGQSARTTEYRVSVAGVKECHDEATQPKAGEMLLGVELLVEAVGSEKVSIGMGRAEVVDVDGHSYSAILYWNAPCGPKLDALQVQPGSRARGWMAFVVPRDSKGLVMHYRLPFVYRGNNLLRLQLDR